MIRMSVLSIFKLCFEREKSRRKNHTMSTEERFQLLTSQQLSALEESSSNENTKKSTNTWIRVYQAWAEARNKNLNMEEYSPTELNEILCSFYGEIRRQDGKDYEPDSLRVMQAAIHRYLSEKKYVKSIYFWH